MSILGKVLIVFNLLAAGAFAYFTLENWKIRQDLGNVMLGRAIALGGLPVNKADGGTSLPSNHVAFPFQPRPGLFLESIDKDRLKSFIPAGDERFGGGAEVASQEAELIRLQEKVNGLIPPAGDAAANNARFQQLATFLINLARTGPDRDGVNALFDYRDPRKAYQARRDLPYLARSTSQVAGLKTLVELAELAEWLRAPNVDAATKAGKTAGAKAALTRFVNGEKAEGEAPSADLDNATKENLTTGESVAQAIKGVSAYVLSKATGTAETAALTDTIVLINPPAVNFDINKTVDSVATNRLAQHFEEALQAGNSVEGKGRRIARILYHIDADRHMDAAQEAARKAWHQRVATIVGLPEYVRTAEAQASEYQEAAQRLLDLIASEESSFRAEYQTHVQRARDLFSQWQTLDNQLKGEVTIATQNEQLLAERITERDNLKKELDKSREDARLALERLSATQAQLFSIQKNVRDAQAAVLELEQQLKRLELGQ